MSRNSTAVVIVAACAIAATGCARSSESGASASPATSPPVAARVDTAAAAPPAGLLSGRAEFRNPGGERIGQASLEETAHGVLVRARFTRLPPGPHAFHIHENGRCEPDFEAAGGHFNPTGREHGFDNPRGAHGGDLPNIHVPDSGQVTVEVLASGVTLATGTPNSLLDPDGSALIVHDKPDDYRSNPAGEAGARIACGVITG